MRGFYPHPCADRNVPAKHRIRQGSKRDRKCLEAPMKPRVPYLIAALLAAGAVQHTLAQAPADDPTADAPTVPYVPAWIPKGGSVPAEQREGGRNFAPGDPLTYVQ